MSFFGSLFKKGPAELRPGKWQVGDRITDSFEVRQILGGEGKSGMGIVYACYDHEHQIPMALKTLQDRYFFSQGTKELFEREALVWTKIEKHPYIVRAFSVMEIELKKQFFILLEYIPPDKEGRNTLTHYLGSLSFPDILKLSIQFCYGMEYAYSKGIDAHRDIKPDNIMITHDKTVKITDFGLVKAFQEMRLEEDLISAGDSPSLSVFQSKGKRICGTLPYMAPEQFDGCADKRSDVYSFGITLYQMVANGRLPFIGKTPEEYERLHRYEKAIIVSSTLSSTIQKCLEKEPNSRFQDFVVLREQLQELLLKEAGEKIAPPEIGELNAWELNNTGSALGSLGKYREAVAYYDKAIELDSINAVAWGNKGVILHRLEKYEEALGCCDKAIEINPKDFRFWTTKGIVLMFLEKYEEALTCFDKAIEIEPKHAYDAWVNKGDALFKLSQYQEAILCCDKTIGIIPKVAKVWNIKGHALVALKKYQESIFCFDEVIEIDSKYFFGWFGKGAVLMTLHRFKEALICLKEAIKIDPNDYDSQRLIEVCLRFLRR